MSKFGDMLSKPLYHRQGTKGGAQSRWRLWGKAASRWTIFYNLFENKNYFNAIGSHLALVHSHLKELDFLTFQSLLKKTKLLIVQSSFYLQFNPKTGLKSCILVLNFVSDLAQVGASKIHCILAENILAVNNNPLEDLS